MSTLAPSDRASPAAERPEAPPPPPDDRTPRAVARRGAGVLALRVVALGLSVGTGVLLARLLGPSGFGVYETAMAWAGVLGVAAGLGAEKLVVREVAAAREVGDWSRVRGVVRAAVLGTAGTAALVAVTAWIASATAGDHVPTGFVLVAVGIVPIVAWTRIGQASLQGIGAVVRGQIPELIVAPLVLCGSLVGCVLLMDEGALDARTALVCQLAAVAAGLAWVAVSWRQARGAPLRETAPRYELLRWARAVVPLCGITALLVVHARANVVLLDVLSSSEQVGLFGSANRAAALLTIGLVAANAVLAPTVAGLHASGRRGELQSAAVRCTRWAFAVALPIAALFVFGGDLVLSLFGSGFVAAHDALVVLSLAQLLNVAMGSVGLILMMAGHARDTFVGLLAGALVNLSLDFALIPSHGALGAAIATGAGVVVWNVCLTIALRRRLGVGASVFGGLRWRK